MATKSTRGEPEPGTQAIRVSGALIKRNDADPRTGRRGRCFGGPQDKAVGACQCRHQRGILRGQGTYHPLPILPPLGYGSYVMLARAVLPTVEQALAGPHGDLPELECGPFVLQRAGHEVAVVDGGAADGNKDV